MEVPGHFTPGTQCVGGLVGTNCRSGRCGEEKSLPLPGIEPRFLGRPSRRKTGEDGDLLPIDPCKPEATDGRKGLFFHCGTSHTKRKRISEDGTCGTDRNRMLPCVADKAFHSARRAKGLRASCWPLVSGAGTVPPPPTSLCVLPWNLPATATHVSADAAICVW
jgi:hypothetical protein